MSDIQKTINQHYFYRLALEQRQHSSGFSLIETMIVVIIVGVLAAIAGPSWVAFIEGRKLSVAQDRLYQALQEAQSNAKKEKITWQVSFRENSNVVQWAVHLADPDADPDTDLDPATLGWQTLDSAIRIIDTDVNASDPNATTFSYDDTNNMWGMQFNYKGNANGQIGKITLSTRNNNQNKKCVFVSTLLGAMRMAQDSECN